MRTSPNSIVPGRGLGLSLRETNSLELVIVFVVVARRVGWMEVQTHLRRVQNLVTTASLIRMYQVRHVPGTF